MSEVDGSSAQAGATPLGFSARDAMLEWMQEIAPYGVFTTDADLRVRSWNQWLVTHSGLSTEKVVGRAITDLYPEIRERKLEQHFHRAINGEVSVLSTALHRYLLPFDVVGRDVHVPRMLQTARIAPLPPSAGVVGTITIIEDVTQREYQAQRLQRQQEHDHLLSSALALLLGSTDPLRDIPSLFPRLTLPLGLEVYFNYVFDPVAQELRLSSAGGIAPKHREAIARLQLGEGPCGHCAAERHAVIIPDVQQRPELFIQFARAIGLQVCCSFPLMIGERLLGTLAFGSYSAKAVPDDELETLSTLAQYVAVAVDRTLREQALRDAQQSLSLHAGTLETKVAERTAKLHETIAQLESFSYSVAHDLRAPIRALRGYCDILQHEFALPAGSELIVARLQRASTRLDALTRDLLKFSKISRQDVQLEPVEVAEVVNDLLLITPGLHNGVLRVEKPLGVVLAQRSLLQQCLANLLDNAVKFAAPDRPPRIVIRSELREDSAARASGDSTVAFNPVTRSDERPRPEPAAGLRLRIWVEDNGIGIASSMHQKIFGIFERVGGQENVEGTGIGLAIVASATQQMSGTFGVESSLGAGSRFWLEFAPAPSSVPARIDGRA